MGVRTIYQIKEIDARLIAKIKLESCSLEELAYVLEAFKESAHRHYEVLPKGMNFHKESKKVKGMLDFNSRKV